MLAAGLTKKMNECLSKLEDGTLRRPTARRSQPHKTHYPRPRRHEPRPRPHHHSTLVTHHLTQQERGTDAHTGTIQTTEDTTNHSQLYPPITQKIKKKIKKLKTQKK